MNRYSQKIIHEFRSRPNVEHLYTQVVNYFNHPRATNYLNDNMYAAIENFAQYMEYDLSMSDPMPGVTLADQVNCYNNQFISYRIKFISAHVFCDEHRPTYSVNDGMSTTRHGTVKSAQDTLKIWYNDPARTHQARSDNQGDLGYGSSTVLDPACGPGQVTGIDFCDQSDLGTQNHVEQYENTFYKNRLNQGHLPHEETPFGVSTPAADTRFSQRPSFRRNEAGVENGIPRYESRLYNRYLERDVSEGLRNAEKGCILLGHDMESLRCRLDKQSRQQLPSGRSALRLQTNY